jgi:predicted enzyme involved in methoxymalonyl-ACP biosynthesis
MESAMLDQMVATAKIRGIKTILGNYHPTAKNGIVNSLFQQMGFTLLTMDEFKNSCWKLDLAGYVQKNIFIEIT